MKMRKRVDFECLNRYIVYGESVNYCELTGAAKAHFTPGRSQQASGLKSSFLHREKETKP